jgi:hypothetical protein
MSGRWQLKLKARFESLRLVGVTSVLGTEGHQVMSIVGLPLRLKPTWRRFRSTSPFFDPSAAPPDRLDTMRKQNLRHPASQGPLNAVPCPRRPGPPFP